MQTKKNITSGINTKQRETRKPCRKPRSKHISMPDEAIQENKPNIDRLLDLYDDCDDNDNDDNDDDNDGNDCGNDGNDCGNNCCVFSKKRLVSTLLDGTAELQKDYHDIATEAETELFCIQFLLFIVSPYLMFKGIKTNDRVLLSISVAGLMYAISKLGSFSQLSCL